MNTLTIFYDAHCGLCSRFRRWMLDQPAYVRLDFMPYDCEQARKRCPELAHLRADQEIVVMGDDGSLWQGAGAWVTCLWALREYREWSLRLASPNMQQIARRVVHWISSNRISLSHLLRLRGDDALRAQITSVACESGVCGVET
ncbi:MAG: DCC1-like thiol-disulfide oxidoreductase family protein [Prosthecobacter sp.]|nr:DCC1-like thiol-disulfide oxidoreductase family protein [Prosthecobacter sp.]